MEDVSLYYIPLIHRRNPVGNHYTPNRNWQHPIPNKIIHRFNESNHAHRSENKNWIWYFTHEHRRSQDTRLILALCGRIPSINLWAHNKRLIFHKVTISINWTTQAGSMIASITECYLLAPVFWRSHYCRPYWLWSVLVAVIIKQQTITINDVWNPSPEWNERAWIAASSPLTCINHHSTALIANLTLYIQHII